MLRGELRDGEEVTRALFSVGYGSTSRLYENADEHLGMTPASYRAGGEGATVMFTIVDSYLGALLVAVTERGLCKIDLANDASTVEENLHDEFHAAEHPARRRRARARGRRGARPPRGPGPRPRPPLRRAGYRVPAQCVGGAAPHPAR